MQRKLKIIYCCFGIWNIHIWFTVGGIFLVLLWCLSCDIHFLLLSLSLFVYIFATWTYHKCSTICWNRMWISYCHWLYPILWHMPCRWLESSTAYPILRRDGLLSSRSPKKPVKLSTTNLPDQKLQLLQIHSGKGGGKVARALWLPVFTGCQCLLKWKSLQQPRLSVSGGLFLLLLLGDLPRNSLSSCSQLLGDMQHGPSEEAWPWAGLLKLMYTLSYTSTLVTCNYVLIELQAIWLYSWSFSISCTRGPEVNPIVAWWEVDVVGRVVRRWTGGSHPLGRTCSFHFSLEVWILSLSTWWWMELIRLLHSLGCAHHPHHRVLSCSES